MPFKLNEAPEIVLSRIKDYDTERKYDTYCATCCCPCTCCWSMGLCFWCCNLDNEHDGFCPTTVEAKSKGYIEALINSLKILQINKKDVLVESSEIIEEQVYNTIILLRDVIKNLDLHLGYKRILKETLEKIEARAKTEEEFFKKISMRLMTDKHIPNYGLTEMK